MPEMFPALRRMLETVPLVLLEFDILDTSLVVLISEGSIQGEAMVGEPFLVHILAKRLVVILGQIPNLHSFPPYALIP